MLARSMAELEGTGRIRRGFAELPDAEIHYAEVGTGDPVLLLHQTPRSWTEYRHVLPLLGRRRRAIAMDTLGYGDSSKPPRPEEDSIEGYAAAVVGLLDALGIERASLVGHHTGGVIAIEVAASRPERVDRLVLSCTPFTGAEGRRDPTIVDDVEHADDGSHLVGLWRGRHAMYPEGRPELLREFMIDALRAGPRAAEGHRAVWRYRMEDRIGRVRAPALLIAAPRDPAYRGLGPMRAALPGSRVVEIPEGMVPLPEQLPEQFAAAIETFLNAPDAR
jgi:pimeloyl-ACP methyl ester carboxylesterase